MLTTPVETGILKAGQMLHH